MSYVALTPEDRELMLASVGVDSMEDLFAGIPAELRQQAQLDLPAPLSEPELLRHLEELAGQNRSARELTCFLGGGIYDHFIPSLVLDVTARPEFKTAYTPYQPEVSQGLLQAIYEYQTMICELTGMEVANASAYDGATATAEAALMAIAHTRRQRVVVSEGLHPAARSCLQTHVWSVEVEISRVGLEGETGQTDLAALEKALGRAGRPDLGNGSHGERAVGRPFLADDAACVIVQHPNFLGVMEDVEAICALAKQAGALVVVNADPISLGLLKPPGDYGADIAVGEGQPLGLPMSFGGPLLGYIACTEGLLRRLPGRIVGATTDGLGRRGYCLTLQAREQHIRREKATSNICTNEALCALAAGAYLALMGPQGLRQVAALCACKAHYAHAELCKLEGCEPAVSGPFFREFAVKLTKDPEEVCRALLDRGILAGLPLGRHYPQLADALLVAVTEKRTKADIDALVEGVRSCL